MTINSPTVVKTCGGINICDEISLGKQTLALSSNGQEILISNGNIVQLPDSSVTNELQTLSLDSSGTLSISQGNQVKLGDNSPTNEIQTLSLDSSGRLSISQGNQVLLADASATNEIQTLSLDAAGRLSISQGNEVILADSSATNELQTLTLDTAGKLSISQGNQVTLVDNSVTNELQNLSLDSSGTLSISQGNQVILADNNATNELQTLSLDSSGTLTISQGNQVVLGDNSATNELQTLSLSGTKLSISSQNTVDMSAVPSVRASFQRGPINVPIALSPAWSTIANITVTPPDNGVILTRWCGSVYSSSTGLKGYSFHFSNSTDATYLSPTTAMTEVSDVAHYLHVCTEWWWPVITPNSPVTFICRAQSGISGTYTTISQISAIFYYGGF